MIKEIAGIIRLPFLTLAPACVALGASVAWLKTEHMDMQLLLEVIIGATLAAVSVNALNEYSDFKNGLDFKTHRTAFSGGSGTLPKYPEMAPLALKIGIASFVAVLLFGIYFTSLVGVGLLFTGLAGLVIIASYNNFILKHKYIVLVASGFGFGVAMVMGTEFVLSGSYSLGGFLASLIMFFLVNNLLLINQIPDIEPDKNIGRKNVLIVFGAQKALAFVGALFVLAYMSIILGVLTNALPLFALLGLLTVPAAMVIFKGLKGGVNGEEKISINGIIPFIGMNVALVIATPLLTAAGVVVSKLI